MGKVELLDLPYLAMISFLNTLQMEAGEMKKAINTILRDCSSRHQMFTLMTMMMKRMNKF